MQSPQEIIDEFVNSLETNPKVHKKVFEIVKELNAERKLNAKNLKDRLDAMINETEDDQNKKTQG